MCARFAWVYAEIMLPLRVRCCAHAQAPSPDAAQAGGGEDQDAAAKQRRERVAKMLRTSVTQEEPDAAAVNTAAVPVDLTPTDKSKTKVSPGARDSDGGDEMPTVPARKLVLDLDWE